MRVVVAQKGAREHFLAARALHRKGILAQLVVDWYAPRNPLLQWIFSHGAGRWGRGALAARAAEIPDSLVRPNRVNGLLGKWKQCFNPLIESRFDANFQADVAFTKTVARLRFPPHDVFFGYSYMSLEALEIEREKKVLTVLDQIDPGPVEFRLVAEEMAARPELAGLESPFPVKYYDRLRREWELADVIAVNSEWSRAAIISEGADPAKIEVLPLAYEGSALQPRSRESKPGAGNMLRVLFLGQVNVRKGIHYLMEAAQLLEGEKVHFDIVGSIGILPAMVASAPRNMTFHGPVSRDRAVEWYKQSDVFVLPTLSDGFAITQLEAMSHGLPVIVTPNCGKVVEEGKTGYIVTPRDARSLADAILKFAVNRDLSFEMAPACHATVAAFSFEAYAQRLVEIIEKHLKQGPLMTQLSGRRIHEKGLPSS